MAPECIDNCEVAAERYMEFWDDSAGTMSLSPSAAYYPLYWIVQEELFTAQPLFPSLTMEKEIMTCILSGRLAVSLLCLTSGGR